MYLIVGLGNPGLKYRNTRHNVGFRVVDLWAKSLGVRLDRTRFQGRFARTRFQNAEVILLRPMTFMNRSGESVRACIDFFDLQAENALVVHDDVDLPVGRVKVVRGGGAGGHKGVLSAIQNLGTHDFPRIKVGVGRPRYAGESVEDHVLKSFYRDEKEVVERVVKMAAQACELVVDSGVDAAMNHFNSMDLAVS
ncbi:MAG: aminoacyl-tRNA hydrolase [Deltaproteobacteria bacterium]|nr:aminoacyl-tRNA hydrolase [Deltaproteobacteria bacterium]